MRPFSLFFHDTCVHCLVLKSAAKSFKHWHVLNLDHPRIPRIKNRFLHGVKWFGTPAVWQEQFLATTVHDEANWSKKLCFVCGLEPLPTSDVPCLLRVENCIINVVCEIWCDVSSLMWCVCVKLQAVPKVYLLPNRMWALSTITGLKPLWVRVTHECPLTALCIIMTITFTYLWSWGGFFDFATANAVSIRMYEFVYHPCWPSDCQASTTSPKHGDAFNLLAQICMIGNHHRSRPQSRTQKILDKQPLQDSMNQFSEYTATMPSSTKWSWCNGKHIWQVSLIFSYCKPFPPLPPFPVSVSVSWSPGINACIVLLCRLTKDGP